MTYNVFGGMLNLAQSINALCTAVVHWVVRTLHKKGEYSAHIIC